MTPIDTEQNENGVFVPRERNPLEVAVDQACDAVEGIGEIVERVQDARRRIRDRVRAKRGAARLARVLDAEEL
jgi:hypothetical protein